MARNPSMKMENSHNPYVCVRVRACMYVYFHINFRHFIHSLHESLYHKRTETLDIESRFINAFRFPARFSFSHLYAEPFPRYDFKCPSGIIDPCASHSFLQLFENCSETKLSCMFLLTSKPHRKD